MLILLMKMLIWKIWRRLLKHTMKMILIFRFHWHHLHHVPLHPILREHPCWSHRVCLHVVHVWHVLPLLQVQTGLLCQAIWEEDHWWMLQPLKIGDTETPMFSLLKTLGHPVPCSRHNTIPEDDFQHQRLLFNPGRFLQTRFQSDNTTTSRHVVFTTHQFQNIFYPRNLCEIIYVMCWCFIIILS